MRHLEHFKKKIRWYPVSTLGWIFTTLYFSLLLYVVVSVNRDLYTINKSLFNASMLMSGLIVVTLFWARITGEQPFAKKK